MRTGVLSLIFAVIAVGCLASPAAAGHRGSLDQILPQIRERHPGTFSDADGPFMGSDGRPHYRIKWVTPEGRIQWFDADAQTGRVTNVEGRRNDIDDRGNRDSDSQRRRDRFGNDGSDDPYADGDRRNDDWRRRHDGDRNDWHDNGGDRGDWGGRDRGRRGNPFGGDGPGGGGGGGRHRGHGN